jgi:hypothetical protein
METSLYGVPQWSPALDDPPTHERGYNRERAYVPVRLWLSAPQQAMLDKEPDNERRRLPLNLEIEGFAMRPFALTFAAVATLIAAWGVTAAAQNDPDRSQRRATSAPQTTGQDDGRRQAPIGHRQPTPKDLPSGLEQNLGTRSLEDQALDRKMQICRGC